MEKDYQSDPHLVVEPAYYNNGVPVFEPTMKQFEDFYKFNKAINKYGMQSGIVKIIPPVEWLKRLEGTYTPENLSKAIIKNPIVQNMNVTAGYKGVFSSHNVERQRRYNIFQWKELSEKPNHRAPAHKKTRRGLPSPSEKKQESTPASLRSKSAHVIDKILDDESFNIDASEFTDERCEELEQLYWKSLGYAEPMYGADMLGSLFLGQTKSWNVAQLPNILDLMDEKLPGVNDAYLYAGLWKATFSWHLEDQDLYSINYLHFGAPKQWYSIPQSEHEKFYNLMKEIFDEDYRNCTEFLRHKTFLASPQFLEKNGITCNSVVHHQGEFMITYPYGYHAGFNYGYNLAESVNFALDDWFEFADKCRKCECIGDSVGINHRQMYCKFKGIPYVPPLASQVIIRPESPLKEERVVAGRKSSQARKRPKVEKVDYQCVLCTSELPPLLTKFSPFELLATDKPDPLGNGLLQVHRMCAQQFSKHILFRRSGQTECVTGLDSIPRAQRAAKCLVCHVLNRSLHSKAFSHGACIQCSASKCNKWFHPTCALTAGFLFNASCCKQHRTIKSPYYAQGEAGLVSVLSTVPVNSLVQFTLRGVGKRHAGETFCGLVVANNAGEQSFDTLVYPALTEGLEVFYEDVMMGKSPQRDNEQLHAMKVLAPARLLPRKRASEPTIVKEVSPPVVFAPPPTYPFPGNYTFEMRMGQNLVFVNDYIDSAPPPPPKPHCLRFVEETFNH